MAYITTRSYMVRVIVHVTISEQGRLQCFHIWFGVIIHATISGRRRLQCFHIWFGVIVHATINERHRLQCFHICPQCGPQKAVMLTKNENTHLVNITEI